MKKYNSWQCILLAILLMPALVMAQDYNMVYGFSTPYENSVHTCGYQLTNGLIAEGGTVENPAASPQKVVEIGLVDPNSGSMTPSPYYYFIGDYDLMAADLIESSVNSDEVVVAANLHDPASGGDLVVIFKTNPATGAIAWSKWFGAADSYHYASAITRDNRRNYYVIGHTVDNSTGQKGMYLISINNAGVVNWDRGYNTTTGVVTDHLEGIDVLFDGTDIIVTGNYTNPGLNGVVIGQVARPTGAILSARHVTSVDGTSDFEVKDMDFINGNYVLVGKIHSSPVQGYMLQYTPGLTPYAPFSTIYSVPFDDIFMTGVKPSGMSPPDMYVSFDLTIVGAAPNPGMSQVDMNGVPNGSPHYYMVNGYLESRGLIGVNSFNDMVVKGATDNSSYAGIEALSMVGAATPLSTISAVCNDPITINDNSNATETSITLDDPQPDLGQTIDIDTEVINGDYYDCMSVHMGSFRLSAPTGNEELGITPTIRIYPNPSDGNFTIELDGNLVEQFVSGEVFNTLGEMVMSFNVNSAIQRIDLSKQVPGIYLLRFMGSDGAISDAKRILFK